MSDAVSANPALSKEDMETLLEEFALSRTERDGVGSRSDPLAAYRDELEAFSAQYAKRLSTIYQRRILWTLRDLRIAEVRDLAPLHHSSDLFWIFETEGGWGWLHWNRSLIFAWLQVAFGAVEPRGLSPERKFTAIERSFLGRLGEEGLEILGPALAARGLGSAGVGTLRDLGAVLHHCVKPMVWARLEVEGFGDRGRVDIALPHTGASGRTASASAGENGGFESGHPLMTAPIPVQAEVGAVELTLGALASLRPGDVLPLDAATDGTVLLKVGGHTKFRARRGSVGGRLAVQVTDRIGESGGGR